jgi:hypothetical protein
VSSWSPTSDLWSLSAPARATRRSARRSPSRLRDSGRQLFTCTPLVHAFGKGSENVELLEWADDVALSVNMRIAELLCPPAGRAKPSKEESKSPARRAWAELLTSCGSWVYIHSMCESLGTTWGDVLKEWDYQLQDASCSCRGPTCARSDHQHRIFRLHQSTIH